MAERKRRRLTNRMQDGCAYVQSETGKEGVGYYTTQRRLPELITFTCKVEDIMEKYGIESVEELSNALEYAKVIGEILCEYGINDNENLEWFLEDYSKNQGRDFAICEERDTLRQERDTWQKACELACETMTKLGGDDCCGCRLNKEMCNICENKKALIDYFYQQAKTEGNDDK